MPPPPHNGEGTIWFLIPMRNINIIYSNLAPAVLPLAIPINGIQLYQ